MRNWQASKRQIIRKSTKTDDVLTIFIQNINSVLEKATTLNTIGISWNMIIISIDLFQGFFQGLQFKGFYLRFSVISSFFCSSVVGSSLGPWVQGMYRCWGYFAAW